VPSAQKIATHRRKSLGEEFIECIEYLAAPLSL
jgi:hypothetical protein